MNDICGLARWAYDHDQDPIDYAVTNVVKIHIDVWVTVCAGRMDNPASFPAYPADLSLEVLGRRILGDLLDAGWTAPQLTEGEAS